MNRLKRGWGLVAKSEGSFSNIAIWPTERAVDRYLREHPSIERRKPRKARIEYRVIPKRSKP